MKKTIIKSLKNAIKNIVGFTVFWNTVGAYLRKPGVYVLMYHRVSDNSSEFSSLPTSLFREHVLWLMNNCTLIDEKQMQSCLRKPRRIKPYVLITFDDGQKCMSDDVYPILKELNVPASIFLATGKMDDGGLIWTDEINWAFQHTIVNKIVLPWEPEKILSLESRIQKQAALDLCKSYLKSCTNSTRESMHAEILNRLDVTDKIMMLPREMLNWEEVRRCADVFDYGGHTRSHPIMSMLSDNELEEEIESCTSSISQHVNTQPFSFAYPNGRKQDYDERCKRILKNNGYQMAFSTTEGVNTVGADLFDLKRIPTTAKLRDLVWMMAVAK